MSEDIDLFLRVGKMGVDCRVDPQLAVKTVHPAGILDLLRQRIRWGEGYREITVRHRSFSMHETRGLFVLIVVTLASVPLSMFDVKTAVLFMLPPIVTALSIVPSSVRIARRARRTRYFLSIVIVRAVSALGYSLGYHYMWLREIIAGKHAGGAKSR